MPISFDLSPEQEALRKTVAEFAQKHIAAKAGEIDENQKIPEDIMEKICKPPNRFTSAYIPKKYGGLGLDMVSISLILEEIGYISPSCAIIIQVAGVGALPILFGGTEQQKEKCLRAMGLGEAYPAFALTEKAAGSDAGAIELKAERKGGDYVLNGRKRLICNADIATFAVVFGKTDPEKGVRGISAFIVEKDASGFKVGRRERTVGMRGDGVYELIFENCRVPEENLVGEKNEGFRLAMRALDDSRITIAAINIGIARAALDTAVRFAKERVAFGKQIAEFEGIRFPIADLAMEIQAARLLTLKAAWLADRGMKHSEESSMAKLYASQLAVKASEFGMNALGGFGATVEYPVERYLRDALTMVSMEGTLEVQKLVISRELLK